MTKKIGKERDNGKQKKGDRLWPRGLGGRDSEWERDGTEYREKVVFFVELVLFRMQTGGYRTK